MTIFLTTHYLEEADTMAERVVVMDEGRIIADGTASTLKRELSTRSGVASPTLDDVFLDLTGRSLRDQFIAPPQPVTA